jgi:hypothetical protein
MAQRMSPDFDPGMRSSIELLWGLSPTDPDQIRGRTVRGRSRYSTDEAIRAATSAMLPRSGDDLRTFARSRPRCGYAHSAGVASCRDADCQSWLNEVVAWHAERFGPRHFDITVATVFALSVGQPLSLQVSDGSWRDAFDPSVVALDLGVKRQWVMADIGIHASATKSDLHDLVDRLWPEIVELRARAGLSAFSESPSNGRAGRLDRPVRATYWRLRQFHGLTVAAIADEWELLTRRWSEMDADGQVDLRRLEYPAWLEWRARGVRASAECFEEVGSIQRAIAKLRSLTGESTTP